jgi:hypothetical protein
VVVSKVKMARVLKLLKFQIPPELPEKASLLKMLAPQVAVSKPVEAEVNSHLKTTKLLST